jgi:hypothetical protein
MTAEMGLGAANCKAAEQLTTPYLATSGNGTIIWVPPMMCPFCIPTTLNIHATLYFPPGPSWLPAMESLDADGVVVEPWQ